MVPAVATTRNGRSPAARSAAIRRARAAVSIRRPGPDGTRRTASRPMPVACAIFSQARWLSADAYMTGRPGSARTPSSP
nr:hypothetical protein [Actinomadura madurae]